MSRPDGEGGVATPSGPLPVWPGPHAAFPPGSLPARGAALAPVDAVAWTGNGRRAAVLMLFLPPDPAGAPARLVFTRRSARVRSHRGQVGFAGGRAEPGDATPAATALRELEEELGLAPERAVTFGLLPPVSALDGAHVYPVVGVAAVGVDALRPAPDEVESVFAAPWPYYGVDQAREFRFNIFGVWRTSRVYTGGAAPVWGLTAQILASAALSA